MNMPAQPSENQALNQSTAAPAPEPLRGILERHRAFWLRADVDRPLLDVFEWKGWNPPAPTIFRDGSRITQTTEIQPGRMDPRRNLEITRPSRQFLGDILGGWGPYDLCWAETILGCKVFRTGPSAWSQPFVEDWTKVDGLSWSAEGNAWLNELVQIMHLIEEEARGEYPVCQPLLRGPLDMVEACVPTEILYVGFYSEPDALARLLGHCCEVFLAIARRLIEARRPFYGGTMTRADIGLWAPGTVIDFQADAMRNLSPQNYRDFCFPIDRRIESAFDFSILHTHSGSLHMIPLMAEEAELSAVQVAIDPTPYGPAPLDLIPVFRHIQSSGKALHIMGPLKQSELDRLLGELSPVGLAIRAGIIAE